MILTLVSFSLILTPLNIATRAPNGWKTDSIVAMIVVGVVCLAGIAAWEKCLLRWYGRYHWLAIFDIPLCVLGTALLIHFRQPGNDIGHLVMCQVFYGHSPEIAVVIVLYSMIGSIGQVVGFGISGALWTNDLPTEMFNLFPRTPRVKLQLFMVT
ncbi:hypothetical protein FAVG1_03804 [Fusarium avenaceum]|nr:hypothetical protein FAVG1_03804 [Fusarium avenaceum]